MVCLMSMATKSRPLLHLYFIRPYLQNMGISPRVVYMSQHMSELLYLKSYVMLFKDCSSMTLKPFYLMLKTENEVSNIEASKIKVSWPHEHLAKLHKVTAFREKSFELKKVTAKSGLVTKAATKELKQRHAELLLAQEHFKEAEKCVNAMGLVSQKIDDDILECESEEYFWKTRLDDLL